MLTFFNNTATIKGSNLFGGLLNRCIPSQIRNDLDKNGITYIRDVANITDDSIASLPVQVCFCNSQGQPDCDYEPPTILVEKGGAFSVSLVAVDQVEHPVDASITSYLLSFSGAFDEGQRTQPTTKTCKDLTFNVISPNDGETMGLFAEGPCGNSQPLVRYLNITFISCTCPIGFQQSNDSSSRCVCVCDLELHPYITLCDVSNSSLTRVGTNSWIAYTNDTHPTGYVIHPNCPFDYCYPPTETISMNLNLPDGADAQCAYNRTGVLCGACQENLSLSLGSSRCLPCESHWPAVLVAILLTAIIAGILLVIVVLALNMTVAFGLINGFIFYANIVEVSRSVYLSSSEPGFPPVFVAWLNLDIGFDVCFIDGLDAFYKAWFQLAFPTYIISLVVLVIVISEYSHRFARLIGKRDPVATLATLILLSYAKLLSVTITVLSFAKVHYPDGSQEVVWLPDGNVKYFQGKHIALGIVALFIILIGVPYTILLFFWQWLVRASRWKIFKWTRNTKLNAFITSYHCPYNYKHRYWTGLLLLVRVVLYITAAATVSANPQIPLFMTNLLVGGLLFLKGSSGIRVYKKSFVDIVNMSMYLNILGLSVISLYDFNADVVKQTAVAYTSTLITFILFVGVIIYHVALLIKKKKSLIFSESGELNVYHLATPAQPANLDVAVTHTSLKLP